MTLRTKLAKAEQRNRDLSNELHGHEMTTVLPLRNRVAELERKLEQIERDRDAYRDLFLAHKDALHAIVHAYALHERHRIRGMTRFAAGDGRDVDTGKERP